MTYLLIRGRLHIAESRRKTEQLQIQQREELKTVMNNIHIGVIIFTYSGEITSANDYAKNLLIAPLLKSDEKLNVSAIVDLKDMHYDELLQDDLTAPNYLETTPLSPSLEKTPIMLSVRKIEIMGQPVYLMTVINITKRKLAEQELVKINESLEEIVHNRTKELKQTQKKLIQTNKAAALGNMAATIVHELSQPLTAMNSSIAAIRAKLDTRNYDGAIESANRLEPLNHKMQDIIKLLKQFSYDDKNTLKPIVINDLFNNNLDTFKDTFNEKNITITIINDQEKYFIRANPVKIDLVFSNIIQNAIGAMETCKNPSIYIFYKKEDDNIRIDIKDNGQGVDYRNIKEMFTPYFTTKEIGKGLGLGLAICYEILHEYDGHISASTSDSGACFSIILPIARLENSIPQPLDEKK